jgi:hypothetical protein
LSAEPVVGTTPVDKVDNIKDLSVRKLVHELMVSQTTDSTKL